MIDEVKWMNTTAPTYPVMRWVETTPDSWDTEGTILVVSDAFQPMSMKLVRQYQRQELLAAGPKAFTQLHTPATYHQVGEWNLEGVKLYYNTPRSLMVATHRHTLYVLGDEANVLYRDAASDARLLALLEERILYNGARQRLMKLGMGGVIRKKGGQKKATICNYLLDK